jgi:hypothetical protein
VSSNTRRSFFSIFLDNWSRNSNCQSPNLTSFGDNTRADVWRFALTRTPSARTSLSPRSNRYAREIGLWPQNSQRTACENTASSPLCFQFPDSEPCAQFSISGC